MLNFLVQTAAIKPPVIAPLGSAAQTSNADFGASLVTIANNALNLVLLFAGIIAVFYVMYSGFQYLTAGGDGEKVKKARAGIVNAVIGIIVIVSAFLIIRVAVSLGRTASTLDTPGTPAPATVGGSATPRSGITAPTPVPRSTPEPCSPGDVGTPCEYATPPPSSGNRGD
jgi:hypothetical protein